MALQPASVIVHSFVEKLPWLGQLVNRDYGINSTKPQKALFRNPPFLSRSESLELAFI